MYGYDPAQVRDSLEERRDYDAHTGEVKTGRRNTDHCA